MLVGLFVGYMPVLGGCGYVATWLGLDGTDTPLWVGYMIVMIIVGSRASLMPCPRCGKPFTTTWISHNPLAKPLSARRPASRRSP